MSGKISHTMTANVNNLVETILDKSAQLERNAGIELMEGCGKSCAERLGTLEAAKEIRRSHNNTINIDLSIDTFKRKVFKDSIVERKGNTIELEYTHTECGCLFVKMLDIKNPMMCNCTRGHTKSVFEALLNRPIEVELTETVLQGGKRCKQLITFN